MANVGHKSDLQDNSLQDLAPAKRSRNPLGWILLSGDLIALFISWVASNVIFFTVPIYTTFIGPNKLPVVEIFSVERFIVVLGVLFLFAWQGPYRDRIHYYFQLQ